MRKIVVTLKIVTMFLVTLALGACSKDSENNTEGYYLRATIDGLKSEAISHYATIGEAGNNATLFLYGRWGDNRANGIDIQHFKFPKATGEYVINSAENIVKASYKNSTAQYGNSTGKLIIESITDTTVKGTFGFVATQDSKQITITEGAFFLPLQKIGKENAPNVSVEVQSILSEIKSETLAQLKATGMEIHEGNTPPNVEGIYLSSPHILMKAHVGDYYQVGHRWPDYKYRISIQQNGYAVLDYKASDANASGQAVYVTGSGNKFTLYARVSGVEKGIQKMNITVLSGEITPEGIQNFKSSYVLTYKEGDTSNRVLMPVGASRVSGDQDKLAKKVDTY